MPNEISNLFVCLMGIGTVFFGLICIVLICKLLGLVVRREQRPGAPGKTGAPAEKGPDRQEEIAVAITAAIAESLRAEFTDVRVLSIKQI
jgi:Na+-transporting methylmalonyl-CoA/oxaloacetate decarboxylase gamma subunit